MGNPVRHIWNNSKFMYRPKIDGSNKQVTITCMGEIKGFYEELSYDVYSAPDVIMTYTNGNNTKDEWYRYAKYKFKNLKLVKVEQNYVDTLSVTFSYECFDGKWLNFDDPEMIANIPMGKFSNMSNEQYQEYRKNNVLR